MTRYPRPMTVPLPTANMKYARAYVLDQPYMCTVRPEEALKNWTIFPFLLQTYLPELEKAEKGER